MKKNCQSVVRDSGQAAPKGSQDGAMLAQLDLKQFADSLWMPSAIEDAHFEEMIRKQSQSDASKRNDDRQ